MSCDVGKVTERVENELSFSNPSFATPTSQAHHLHHLASRPWLIESLTLGAPIGCFDRQALFIRLYFINVLHLISHILRLLFIYCSLLPHKGPGSSSGKALSYGLDGPGSIPGVGGVEIFLCSFVSRLVLGSTQPPIK